MRNFTDRWIVLEEALAIPAIPIERGRRLKRRFLLNFPARRRRGSRAFVPWGRWKRHCARLPGRCDHLHHNTSCLRKVLDLQREVGITTPNDSTISHAADRPLGIPVEIRSHIGAELPTDRAHEVRFDIRQSIGHERDGVAAPVVGAIDQDPAHAAVAHLGKGDFHGALDHRP
jgi:hypothetical protein